MTEPTFATMQDVWEAYHQNHLRSKRSCAHRRRQVARYFAPILALPVQALTVMTVRGWLTDIRTGGNGRMPSESIANSCLTTLRAMINYAIECGMWTMANPASRCKHTRPNRRTVYVTADAMPRLIHVLERHPVMIRLYFYLVLFTGCRPGEAEEVKISDIQHGVWAKPTTKNGEEQSPLLPGDIPQLVQAHVQAGYQGQVYLFENHLTGKPYSKSWWHRIWKDIRRVANIPNVNPHDLRRTCATRLRNSKLLDISEISKGVLGHRDLSTTEIYLVHDKERMRRALTENMRQARMVPPLYGGTHDRTDTGRV